jgi:hypothetical protein
MTKHEIAAMLEEIGTLLELQGENPFKTRAYQGGARALEAMEADEVLDAARGWGDGHAIEALAWWCGSYEQGDETAELDAAGAAGARARNAFAVFERLASEPEGEWTEFMPFVPTRWWGLLGGLGVPEVLALWSSGLDPDLVAEALDEVAVSPESVEAVSGRSRVCATAGQLVVLDRLRAEGVPEDAIARIHAPVGLDIGAKSPAEIAVSILAQITQRLRQG